MLMLIRRLEAGRALWAGVCRLEGNEGTWSTAIAVDLGRNGTEACIRNAHCAWHAGQSETCFKACCGRRSWCGGWGHSVTEVTVAAGVKDDKRSEGRAACGRGLYPRVSY